MKKFDFYEFTGILSPGVLLLCGLAWIYSDVYGVISNKDISVGDLGIIVVLAYVAGHLLQSLGNVLENVWWFCWRGMPSDWVRSQKHVIISEPQIKIIPAKVKKILKIECPDNISTLNKKDWFFITRQMYAIVKNAGLTERIDIFNGNYGMFRGIACSLIVLLCCVIIEVNFSNIKIIITLIILLILSLIRMHRFGVHYVRELFIQFISIQSDKSGINK